MQRRNPLPFALIIWCVIIIALAGAAIFFSAPLIKAFTGTPSEPTPSAAEPAETTPPVEIPAASAQPAPEPAPAPEPEPEPEPKKVTLTFAGDTTLGKDHKTPARNFDATFAQVNDPSYFLKLFYPIFSADDITAVNFEGTITDSDARVDKKYCFKGKPEYLKVLAEGSVEAASVANNHSHDFGSQSFTDTKNALTEYNIKPFGYKDIAYFDKNGLKVALIGTYELPKGMGIKSELEENIATAKAEGAQVIAVFFHWGKEYETTANSNQVNLGRAAIDAGAHVVVGGHSHILQGYEVYKGRYIIYSLGNFCFGGNTNPSDKDALVFQQTFTLDDNGDVLVDDNVNFIPTRISSVNDKNNYQPMPAEGAEKERIMKKLEDRSKH